MALVEASRAVVSSICRGARRTESLLPLRWSKLDSNSQSHLRDVVSFRREYEGEVDHGKPEAPVPFLRGTSASNPLSSGGESTNHQFLGGGVASAEYELILRSDLGWFAERCFSELNPQAPFLRRHIVPEHASRCRRGKAHQRGRPAVSFGDLFTAHESSSFSPSVVRSNG